MKNSSKKLPFVSILIATFNDEISINFTLQSLQHAIDFYASQGGDAEIVIVSDGSTDTTDAIINEWEKKSNLKNVTFCFQENQGVTKALQNAFSEIRKETKYVIRMDADAFLIQENWIFQMVQFAELDDAIGGVGTTVVNPLGMIEVQGINFFDLPTPSKLLFLRAGENYLSTKTDSLPIEVDSFLGTCALIRRDVWNIDTHYRLWTEDVDQALTVRKQGKKNFVLPNLSLFHLSFGFGRKKRDVGLDPELMQSRLNFFRISVSSFFLATIGVKSWTKITTVLKNIHLLKPNRLRSKEKTLYENNVYFKEKWGFDEHFVDIEYVKEKYNETELCWRWNKESQKRTKMILAKNKKLSQRKK